MNVYYFKLPNLVYIRPIHPTTNQFKRSQKPGCFASRYCGCCSGWSITINCFKRRSKCLSAWHMTCSIHSGQQPRKKRTVAVLSKLEATLTDLYRIISWVTCAPAGCYLGWMGLASATDIGAPSGAFSPQIEHLPRQPRVCVCVCVDGWWQWTIKI